MPMSEDGDAGGPIAYEEVAERLDLSTTGEVSKAASVLEARKLIEKDSRDEGMYVDLNTDGLNEVREAAARQRKTEELMQECRDGRRFAHSPVIPGRSCSIS